MVVDGRRLGTTGTRGMRVRRKDPKGARGGELGEVLLALLVPALRLDRAVLLVEERTGGRLVPLATHGEVRLQHVEPGAPPGDGPWSAILPLAIGGQTTGLLLLARADGAELPPGDRQVAELLADAAAGLVDRRRLSAELAHARELLARADRLAALGTLAAGIAHEVRNPLVTIRTFIQLLPERLHDEEFRTGFRDMALGEIDRICGLISDLLSFARPAPVELEPTDLNVIVGEIVRLLDPEARKCNVTLDCRDEVALPPVIGDEAKVKQVLMNVVLNAIQASEPRGHVEVSTRVQDSPAGSRCVIAISDTGPGLAPTVAERIFDPFFTTKDSGSGLGLFIAQRIMSEHGGDIRTMAGERGGAVFLLEFPASGEGRNGRAG